VNKIVDENAITEGRAPQSYWDAEHSNRIEGFATDISVNAGTQVDFKINVNDDAGSDYKVEIFRLGYYGGDGAREVAEWTNTDAAVQPEALYDASRGLVDAGNWSVTDSWQVPEDAVSGVYLARLQRLDANGNPIDGATNQIPFVVRNDGEHHDIVLQTSDTTWQAYNGWGGNNGEVGPDLYGDPSGRIDWDRIEGGGTYNEDRAYAVSYNRPIITDTGQSWASGAQDYLFGADYAAISWLEKNGYDVSYISGVDTDRLGASYLENYKAFISVGHDEYWSGGQRANVEAARDAGVNLLFWSGNECYWKTRWDISISADGTEYRTLVCYKETVAVADPNAGPEDYYNLDPSDIWTGTWRDVRFLGNPLAGGGNPGDVDPITGLCAYCHCGENALTGQLFGPDGTGQFGGALDVPAEYAALRVWRDTTVADGGKLDIAPGILGYEWDTSPDDLLRPAGLIKLSGTTIPWDGILIDQGNTVSPGTATHNLSLYRAESGALVFGAGSTFWSWGLSDQHDSSPYGAQVANTDLQQFTINMFADMGIQPGVSDAFLISQGLKRASASDDHVAATAQLGATPEHLAALSPVTITGTATDDDGNAATTDGKVAVVEVSTDGGATWRVASTTDGWAHWSYTWQPPAAGDYTILARAIDDSLNISTIVADQRTMTVGAPDTYSFFGGVAPKSDAATLHNDNAAVELGMRFTVDRVGEVTELKYWRSSIDAGDTDVREGHLWRADGTLLGTVTFTSAAGETGWQTATLSAPVALQAGVEYIVSYHTADNYVASTGFFGADREQAFDGLANDSFWGPYGVIRSPVSGASGGNGVYSYGSGMPDSSWQGANYWVDLTFDPADGASNHAPTITSPAVLTSPENRTSVGLVTASDVDGDAITYAISGGADAARFVIDARTGLLSFAEAPNFELPGDADHDNVYQVTVSASDGVAAPVTKALSIGVTDVDESGNVSHVFGSGAAPGAVETADPADYELGMRFRPNADGYVTELRYYRGAADAGDSDTRTLTLWTAAGERLGQATITSAAGAAGWQSATLATAVALSANATYIVSYGTTDNYAYTYGWFATAHASDDGVLSGLAGVYSVGPGTFPTQIYNSTNYWLDVAFQQSLNGAPTIAPIVAPATNEDAAPVRVNLLAGASDPDGDAVSVVTPVTVASSNGSRTVAYALSAAGVLTLDPAQFGDLAAGQSETVTVSYKISDGAHAGVANTATIVVEGRDEVVAGLTLTGTASANTLTGGAGNDLIHGLAGGDTIFGNGGNDTIDGGIGKDSIDGGAGNDLFLVRTTEMQGDTIAGGAGTDTLRIDGTADLVLIETSGLRGIEILDGNGHALHGTAAANVLDLSGFDSTIGLAGIYGLAGNDSLVGSASSDTLDGGTNVDTVRGGGGDDTIVIRGTQAQTDVIDGGAGQDRILVDPADGAVTIAASSRITGVETIDGSGVGIQGTSAANILDFSKLALVNVVSLSGLGGADTLAGGTGNDTLTGGAGNDTFVFHFGDVTGDDWITDFDASGNDVIRLDGYASSVHLADAVSYDSLGALIDLADIGGHGTIRLAGVSSLTLGAEDFIFT